MVFPKVRGHFRCQDAGSWFSADFWGSLTNRLYPPVSSNVAIGNRNGGFNRTITYIIYIYIFKLPFPRYIICRIILPFPIIVYYLYFPARHVWWPEDGKIMISSMHGIPSDFPSFSDSYDSYGSMVLWYSFKNTCCLISCIFLPIETCISLKEVHHYFLFLRSATCTFGNWQVDK